MFKAAIKHMPPLPGILETLWYVSDLARNKRSIPLRKRIFGNQLSDLVQQWHIDLKRQGILTQLEPKRVLFFACGLNILEHCLATAFALAHRNCDVQFVWLENLQPDQPDDEYSRRKFKFYYEKALALLPLGVSGVAGVNLEKILPAPVTASMTEIAETQAYIDTVYIKKRETIDTNGCDKKLFQWRIEHGKNVLARLSALLQTQKFDTLITPNSSVLEFGLVYKFCKSIGLPVGSYEFWGPPGQGVFAFGDGVMRIPTEGLWKQDAPHQLSNARRHLVMDLMKERAATQPAKASEDLKMRLGLLEGAPTVLICPNVPFDGVFLGRTTIFPSMRSWLITTVKYLAEYSQLNIIVRAHPHEPLYDPEETAYSILHEDAELLLPRLHFIHPKTNISTYDLMKFADLGVVFSSTTGMEMAAFGIPVICGNLWHYNGKGFTLDPETKEEYFNMINHVLAKPSASRLTSGQIERAWSYLDIFFHQFPLPFPWRFNDFWPRLEDWPLNRVICEEGDERFGVALDRLAGR